MENIITETVNNFKYNCLEFFKEGKKSITEIEIFIKNQIEIFGTAEKGISVLCAVFQFEVIKFDLISFHAVPDLHPQLVLCSQQVDRCHQRIVLSVEFADRFVKYFPVFFVFEIHWQFLPFFYELFEPSAESGVVYVIHGFVYDFGTARHTGDDPFFDVWATVNRTFFISAVMQTASAVTHFCRVLEVTIHKCSSAFWVESRG